MRRTDVMVETAALSVLEAISITGWRPHRIIIAAQGAEPLWTTLGEFFKMDGLDVEFYIAEQVPRVERLRRLAKVCASGDVVIIHDVIFGGSLAEPICNATRELCATGCQVVFLEFPSVESLAHERLRDIYLAALAYPVSSIRQRLQGLRLGLNTGAARLHSGSSTLDFQACSIFDDFSVLSVGPQILQLPLGEAWILVSDAVGKVSIDAGTAGQVIVEVEDGSFGKVERDEGYVVELGFGANPAARALPTSLCEKTEGRMHLGMGDDQLIGGRTCRRGHGDVLVTAGAWLEWT